MGKTDLKFFIALAFYLVLSLIGMGIYAGHLEGEVSKYKLQVLKEHDKVLEIQIKYEEVRDEKQQLEADLADREARLAAAAERERAAKVRASRSRTRFTRTSDGDARGSVDLGVSDITMYCPTGNRTASDKWPRRGMVATISRSIPFGTRVLIDGLGTFTVEDRIGHGSEFDIFTPSCDEADRFGRQHRRVTLNS